MVKKIIILLDLYFCSFTLLVCGEKNIWPNLNNSQEPGFFGPLGPEPLEKKYQEPEPFGKKSGAVAVWKKKSGAGAAKKLAGSPALYSICIALDIYL